ncbi:hypothetical protein PUN28_002180 [Cardiocondyla obscurior]|uniref:Uncharacterized protein n=1 Tax=Cardiocondyla obscurior TaxID=286306 RepID=A0AAW2GSX9_9HYME
MDPPRLTRPPKTYLKGPQDQRIWRDTSPSWPKLPPKYITSLSESVATQTEKHLFDHAPGINEKEVQTDSWATLESSAEEEDEEPIKYFGDEKWGPIRVTLTAPHITYRERL